MAGASDAELAVAVSVAGGFGSLPCAMLRPDQVRGLFASIRRRTSGPLNLNFSCHVPPVPDAKQESEWKRRLKPYYQELGLDPSAESPAPTPHAIR